MKIFRTKSKSVNFWLDVVLITAVLACLCYIFFWPVRVAGNSMSPTINPGDQLIVSRFLGFFGNYDHGDLVLAQLEGDSGGTTAIKRVAAGPGDHLVITGDTLYLNGLRREWPFLTDNRIFVDIILSDNEYFLLGDNTSISSDSRHFGPVTNQQISARILLRYFPLSYIKIF
jgi:signal peptidase I